MHRITEKSYVKYEQRGRHYIYWPIISKDEYTDLIMKRQIRKAFGLNTFEELVASLCGREKLTDDEVDRVRKLLGI